MSHLYLPAEHTDIDLALASAVAEAISSNELFVAWTCDGGTVAAPEVKAMVRKPEPPLRNPFAEALIEIVAAFHAFVNLLFFRRDSHPKDATPAIRASPSELERAAQQPRGPAAARQRPLVTEGVPGPDVRRRRPPP